MTTCSLPQETRRTFIFDNRIFCGSTMDKLDKVHRDPTSSK